MRSVTPTGATWRRRGRGWVVALVVSLLLMGLPAATAMAGDDQVGSISGTVTDDEGTPLEGVDVLLWRGSTTTGPDGSFSVVGLAPGGHDVAFRDPDLRVLRDGRDGVQVTAGASTRLDVVLQRAGVVTGTIVGPDGPLDWPMVRLIGVDTYYLESYDARTGESVLVVEPGRFALVFGATGLVSEYYDDAATLEDATLLTVAAGETVSGIDVVLGAGSTIAGRVTDASGAPAAGVHVYASTIATGSGGSFTRSAETAADGSYTIAALPADAYTVYAEYSETGYWLPSELDAPLHLPPDEVVTGVDLVVEMGGRITGAVTTEGSAVSAVVFSTSSASAKQPRASTAPDGSYSLLVPAGEAIVGFRAAGHVTQYYDDALTEADATPVRVVAGEVTSGIDVELSTGATLTGVVRDTAGRPVSGAELTAISRGDYVRVTTDANGRFSMSGLRGDVAVCVRADGFAPRGYANAPCASDQATIVMPASGSRSITVTLPRSASVSGRVEGPTGEPVEAADVTVVADGVGFYVDTAADGSFTVTDLAPGSYSVTVSPRELWYANQYYDWSWDEAGATAVHVAEGADVTGIDVQLWYMNLFTFTDVGLSHPFVREISWMKANGISTGNLNGTYGPTTAVTRGAMAAFLYRMAGEPSFTPPDRSPFRDVTRSHTFYTEICWLASTGITGGYTDGTFRPGTVVERQAMAAFLYRFAGSPAFTPPARSPFADVATSHTFYTEIAWLAATGVSGGHADGTYRPRTAVDRQSMAAFLNRLDRKVLD